RGHLAECPLPDQGSLGAVPPPGSAWAVCWQELEAIKLKLWAMEQAQRPKPPGEQGPEGEEEDATALLAGQLLSPETDGPTEAVEADHRSVYVGNSSAQAAVELDKSVFRGRVIKVETQEGFLEAALALVSALGWGGGCENRGLRRTRPLIPARKVLAVVFTVLKGGPDFESGAAAGSGVDSRAPRGTIYSAQNN
ncbi:hypothetical protein E2I00_013544, partial [Balaenoptera physalus]